MRKDTNLTMGDLRFIARKREFWAAVLAAGCAGLLLGFLAGVAV